MRLPFDSLHMYHPPCRPCNSPVHPIQDPKNFWQSKMAYLFWTLGNGEFQNQQSKLHDQDLQESREISRDEIPHLDSIQDLNFRLGIQTKLQIQIFPGNQLVKMDLILNMLFQQSLGLAQEFHELHRMREMTPWVDWEWSTLNIDLILCHTQLIVCAVKC